MSRPETDSLSLMKDETSSENSEGWITFYVEIKSVKLQIIIIWFIFFPFSTPAFLILLIILHTALVHVFFWALFQVCTMRYHGYWNKASIIHKYGCLLLLTEYVVPYIKIRKHRISGSKSICYLFVSAIPLELYPNVGSPGKEKMVTLTFQNIEYCALKVFTFESLIAFSGYGIQHHRSK